MTKKAHRIGIIFCGGCDPAYDRVKYADAIKDAFGLIKIKWLNLDDLNNEPVDGTGKILSVLIISGCQTSCPEDKMKQWPHMNYITIKNNETPPLIVAKLLLEEKS